MKLAFLYKQLASNEPEINGLEAEMTSSAFTLTSGNYYCLLFPLSNKGTQRSWWVHFPIPITKSPHGFKCQCLSKGTSALLNQEELEQTDAYLQDQRNKLLPSLNWVCSGARQHEDTVWQEAMVRPSVEAQRPERVHSLHMGEQFPLKWLLTNGRPNYRQDWWVCLQCWIYLSSFFSLWKQIFTHKN